MLSLCYSIQLYSVKVIKFLKRNYFLNPTVYTLYYIIDVNDASDNIVPKFVFC